MNMSRFRAVLDTNTVVASHLTKSEEDLNLLDLKTEYMNEFKIQIVMPIEFLQYLRRNLSTTK